MRQYAVQDAPKYQMHHQLQWQRLVSGTRMCVITPHEATRMLTDDCALLA